MLEINPILLAGGSGTRLWPLSRRSYPKQFSQLLGETSLFQNSAKRLTSSDIVNFAPHIIVTNSDFRFIICEQLQNVGIDPSHILIEPEAKNTAAAILAASIFALSKNRDAVLLAAPSDHVIPDTHEFHKAIVIGLSHVEDGKIVTFGIKPTHPETGYGYLELPPDDLAPDGTARVVRFIEKPKISDAQRMFDSGNYQWNAGIFLFKAADMVKAFQVHNSNILELVSNAVKMALPDLGFLRLDPKQWSNLEDISIDYAIMEKAQNVVAVPFTSNWSDLGGWDAVWSESPKDMLGNATSNRAHAIDCKQSLLRSESDTQQIVGLGLENIIAIAMPDAVLVAHKNKAQEVKKVVELLKFNHIPQAEIFPKDHRPWGWFESLILDDKFQVKRIFIIPGAALSLQSHKHRSEHWIVVNGTAEVTIDKETISLNEGESVYVPLGAIHRMANKTATPVVLIEVQIGTYLGEDDIIRYEDIYSRNKN